MSHLDPAAWVLPGKINAIENALTITGDLSHCRVKSTCDSLCFSVSLTARRAGFGVEKGVDLAEKAHIDPAAWVLPGKINAMGNCAYCNRGLTKLLDEFNVCFIELHSLFDRTQGRVHGGKSSRLT